MTDPARRRLRLELAPRERPGKIAFHVVRWSLLVVLAMLTYLLFPVARSLGVLEVGEIAPREVIAPFEFLVPKTADEIASETAAMVATLRPIYEIDSAAADGALVNTDLVFAALDSAMTRDELIAAAASVDLQLTEEQAAYLLGDGLRPAYERAVRTMMRQRLPQGVARAGFAELENSPEITFVRGDSRSIVPRDSVDTFERLIDGRDALHPDPTSNVGDQVLRKLIGHVFRPTLVYNAAETDRVLQDLQASVSLVRDTVLANERIVAANQRVTRAVHERLRALSLEQLRRGRTEGDFSATSGQILMNALVLALFWVLLMLFLPDAYASIRKMLALTILFALVIAGSAAIARFLPDSPPAELIPIPFAAMMVTVIIGGRLAMVSAMVLAVLVGSQAAFGGVDAVFVSLVGGVVAGLSLRSIRRRNQILVSVVVVAAAFLLIGVTQSLRLDEPISHALRTAGFGGLNAMVSAAFVAITLPLFEGLTGVTTEVTLLELSDPNRPLLRRLATEAPGTYAHSLALANLCEAACNAIGANGLLVRVGCYYHDIGKLKKPQYFVENQMPGVNPHDKLKPEVSASLIRNHVREGLALATEHRLPEAIRAFIPEHHGTMEISYFLDRARSRDGEEAINVDEFRYPGPKPRSIETAVVMLGDSVEAAVRVLEDPSEQKMRDAIDHLFRQRIDTGQLDEAPLTMGQVTQVRDEFVRVFEGVRHNRIDYPTTSGGLSSTWDATEET
ncbi:MAG: HDIG domain-containing protein [Gemmatimonadota bacterium]|nr:MAG: HDIG domain-containing protein [Gemmatimonadota bacterium]